MRLIFMGTPDFAVPTLVELAARGHEIAAVYTRAPKPAGRGMEVQPTPVEREARRLGLPVLTPKTLKDEAAQAAFRAHNADAAVVVAYGLILPKPVLDAPRLGCFNVHASLLPRWRGAAPINRAIMAGDAESGVTIMQMDEGLDTGAMAMAERVADCARHDRRRSARRAGAARRRPDGARAGRAGARLADADAAAAKPASPTPTKIAKDETRIDWAKPWNEVHDHIRGLSPFPGAWFELDGVRVKALRSTRGEGKRRARHGARRPADHRLRRAARCGSRKCSAPASSR